METRTGRDDRGSDGMTIEGVGGRQSYSTEDIV